MTLCRFLGAASLRALGYSALFSVALPLALSLTLMPFSSSEASCALGQGNGFFPKNNLKYPIQFTEGAGLSESDFNQVITRVSKIFTPIVKNRGGILEIQRKWDDSTVNAYAERDGRKYIVAMFGGLARHPLISVDGFSLVLCHEIGHHLGGAPKYAEQLPEGAFMSNEGQADYFGNLKCMRRFAEKDDNEKIVAALTVPSAVEKLCSKSFSNRNDYLICQRNAMAGFNLSKVLADVATKTGEVVKEPTFATPDKAKVKTTFDDHPAAQCRLDTYYAAAVCPKEVNDELSDTTALEGACNANLFSRVGSRPLCWYNSANYNKGIL